MSEPREVADGYEQVVEGVYHWRIQNSAIGGATSSAHAASDGETTVFIDPLQLAEAALAELPAPAAILLTARCHQRSAWRYRRQFGAAVWLPEDATAADEEPDRTYHDGELLPGGLRALRTPGPERPHYAFLLARAPGVLFCPDLIASDESGALRFVPFEYHEDPAETKRSTAALLELPFSVLCLDHGPPLRDDPKGAITRLLASTG
jgi:hypothetical protein